MSGLNEKNDDESYPNYYKLMNIKIDATSDEISKTYKKLALNLHPDKPNGNKDLFLKLNEGYKLLMNKDKRSQYDTTLKNKMIVKKINDAISQQVNISSFTVNIENNETVFTYPCRCLGIYSIHEEEFTDLNDSDQFMVVGCNKCSLNIKVIIDVDDSSVDDSSTDDRD